MYFKKLCNDKSNWKKEGHINEESADRPATGFRAAMDKPVKGAVQWELGASDEERGCGAE